MSITLVIENALSLVSAAVALAETRLVERNESGWYGAAASEIQQSQYCKECFRAGLHGAPIEHAASCAVGQVLFSAKLLRESLAEEPTDEADAQADGWELTRKYAAEFARNRAPVGVLRSGSLVATFKDSTESNCFLEEPVRKIVYDVAGVDVGACAGEGLSETHEEAAAAHAGVFGEAAE